MTDATSPAVEVIVDAAPMSGQFNMTMDAALLQLGAVRNFSVVRIYRWSVPTITLGHFQAAAAKHENPFPELPCVRRLSGGGAILHDNEITYSCVLPVCHPLRQNPSALYELMHAGIIRLLSRSGVACGLRSDHAAAREESASDSPGEKQTTKIQDEPFLCFLRQNPNDIVHTSGVKIVGSAQRRRKGVTLQHGSILLSKSSLTPTIPGIEQLCPGFSRAEFEQDLPQELAGCVGKNWIFRTYSEIERRTFEEIDGQPAD